MFWAALVASGVAMVSMTLFGAWLTRRRPAEPADEPFSPSEDPSDPWAAYRPRPFEDVERPRPRLWPVIAGLTGLVLVGGGIAGARQASSLQEVEADPTTRPFTVEYEPGTPLAAAAAEETEAPAQTSEPVATDAPAEPTAKPATPAPATHEPAATTPPASGPAPVINGSASCSGGTFKVSYSIAGTGLSWVGVFFDKRSVKGGPISGSTYSSSYSAAATAGDHDAEVTADDKAGHHARKLFQAHCG